MKTWALVSAAGLMVLFVTALAENRDFHVNRSGAQGLANPPYRLQVYASERHPQLPATKVWTLEYRFAVPPLPSSPTWNYKVGTVYQWGDVDFDKYGTSGKYKLSDYRFNQITPQLILGSALDANDANYKPTWSQRSAWAIEAHSDLDVAKDVYIPLGQTNGPSFQDRGLARARMRSGDRNLESPLRQRART